MTLLAYSARRALGALLVFLVVIWLLQFAAFHMTDLPTYIGRGGIVTPYPHWLFPPARFQLGLTHEWNKAALEVGIAALGLLALAAAWRLRRRAAV